MNGSRAELYTMQTAANFAALGRYVQSFELWVDAVRRGCNALLGGSNLANIVLNHNVMTAMPLFEILRAMIATVLQEQPKRFLDSDKVICQKLMVSLNGFAQNATKVRNRLLHGTWHIGWAAQDQTDFEVISFHKISVTTDGAQVRRQISSAQELDLYTMDCEQKTVLLQKLLSAINCQLLPLPQPGVISANIFLENERWRVTLPPHTFVMPPGT